MCDYVVRNQDDLKSHMNIVHKKTQHRCNACNKAFRNGMDLEKHMETEHNAEVDCVKCKAVFKSEADAMSHSNNCDEIIPLNICEHCQGDVVSRAALKKHEKRCHGKKKDVPCRNGDSCRWFKYNKCNYSHSQPQNQHPNNQHNQQWKTVQPRQRKMKCNSCEFKFNSQTEKQNHNCRIHNRTNNNEQQRSFNRKDIDCRWGSECFRWQRGTCWFRHNDMQNVSPQQTQSGPPPLYCQLQERCPLGQSCRHKHIRQGFSQRNQRQSRM